jgi:hypothetical protein
MIRPVPAIVRLCVLAGVLAMASTAAARIPRAAESAPEAPTGAARGDGEPPPPPPFIGLADTEVVADGESYSFDPTQDLPPSDGPRLGIVAATAPEHGMLRVDHGQSLTYTPTPGYRGPDRFTYTLSNGGGMLILMSVSVRVVAARVSLRGYSEVIPRAFTASSNYGGYTGLTSGGGMRDGVFDSADSFHGTDTGGEQWIMARLGEPRPIAKVVVVCASHSAPGGWGCSYLNGAAVQVAASGGPWRTVGTIAGAVEDQELAVDIAGGVAVSRVRLVQSHNYLAVGDFRLFTRNSDPK